MPSSQEFSTVLSIDPAPAVKGHRAAMDAEKRHAKEILALEKHIGKLEQELRSMGDRLKGAGRGHKDAASKIALHTRQQQLIARVVKETGVAVSTASRVVRSFGKDIDRAGREAATMALSVDRAEQEVRQLAHAQRVAQGTSLTAQMRAQTAAVEGLGSGLAGSAAKLAIWTAGAVAAAAAIGRLVRLIKNAADAWNVQREAEALAAQALRSTGNVVGLQVSQLKQWASAIQAATGVGDELVLRNEAILLSFRRINREAFPRAIALATDMSARLGTDLKASVLQLGKALEDPVHRLTDLSRSGTTFTEQQKAMVKELVRSGKLLDAQTVILDEIEKQYGGSAAAARKAGGEWKALAGYAGDLLEQVGHLLAAAGLPEFIEKLIDITRSLTTLVEKQARVNEVWDDSTRIVKPLQLLVGALEIAIDGLNRAFDSTLLIVGRVAGALAKLSAAAAQLDRRAHGLIPGLDADELEKTARQLADIAVGLANVNYASTDRPSKEAEALRQRYQDLQSQIAATEAAVKDLGEQHKTASRSAGEALRELEEEFNQVLETIESMDAPEIDIHIEIPPEDLAAVDRILIALEARSREFSSMLRAPVTGVDVTRTRETEDLAEGMERAAEAQREIYDQFIDSLETVFFDLGEMFDRFGGSLASSIGKLFNIASQVVNMIGGFGGKKGAGDYLEAFGTIGDVLKIFTGLYDIASDLIEQSKQRQYGLATEAGISGGRIHGQALAGHRGALNQEQTIELFQQLVASFDAFAVAIGHSIDFLSTLGLKIRNDGKKIEVAVGDVIVGVFDDMRTAIEYGLKYAFSTATIEGLGENLQRALDRQMASLSLEQFINLIPKLQNLDDAAAGISLTMSNQLQQYRSLQTQMDIWSRQLLQTGASLADVNALREAHLALIRQELELQGLQLAGVSSGLPALQNYLDSFDAFNQAAREESDRQQDLADQVQAAADATAVAGGSASDASNDFLKLWGDIDDGGPALEDTAAAARMMEEALREAVTQVVGMSEQLGVLNRIVDFLEKYGATSEETEQQRLRAAQLEFEIAKIQIILAVKQLEVALEMGLITKAQLEQFRKWAGEVADWKFPGLPDGGPAVPGAGAGRREERRRAFEDFQQGAESIANSLAGVSDQAQQFARDFEAFREQARLARVPIEEATEALANMAALFLQDLAAPWEEIVRAAGETDAQTAYRHAGEAAAQALADAAAAAAANPTAYEEARMAIQAGLRASLGQLGEEVLGQLGGPLTQLRAEGAATVQQIQFLVAHMRELELTAGQIAASVRQQVIPQLLDMAIAAAEGAGNLERAAELRARQELLQRQLQMVQLAIWEQMLRAAGALDAGLQEIINNIRSDLRHPLIEDPGAALVDPFRDAMGSMRDLVASTVSDIQSFASAAGVDLPVEMARQWAQVQLELQRAELLVALATPAVSAAFNKLGLDLSEWVAFVTDLTFPTAGAGPGGITRDPSTWNIGPTHRHERLGGTDGDGETGPAGETLAEIIEEMRRAAQSPAEQLRQQWLDMIERINEATGTAAERALALQKAEEAYNRERLQGLRDLQEELGIAAEGGGSPRRAFEAAQEAFRSAVGTGDEAAIEATARRFLEAAGGFTEGFSQRAAEQLARDQILAALGPILGTGAGALATSPAALAGSPDAALLLSSGAAGPLQTPMAGAAPIAMPRLDTSRMEARLEAMEQKLGQLVAYGARTAQTTADTAAGFNSLRPVLRRLSP